MKRLFVVILFLFVMISTARGGEDPVAKIKESIIPYFKPLAGSVIRVEGPRVIMSLGEKDSVKPGMRLKVMREGAPFIHPVTKELLGKVESPAGKVEVRDVQADSASGVVIEGDAKAGDRVRLPDVKVRMFFCQDKNVDWYIADELYRQLKGSGRIEMIDTALETDDEARVLEEAKKAGAEVVILLTAQTSEKGSIMRGRLYWVSDGVKFIDAEAPVGTDYSKELKLGEEFFAPQAGDAVMTYRLPMRAGLLATGDLDGDGKQEVLLSNGKDIKVYTPAVDLQFLWELKGSAAGDHLRIDCLDLNKNGRDEIVITSMRSGEVVSYIYEFSGPEFKLLWEGKYFLRKNGPGLIAQAYSSAEGFYGSVLEMTWNGEYRTGNRVQLPKGVNLYDFVFLEGASKESLVFAYDDKGFLNLYDEKGIRVWTSSSDIGGFLTGFKRETTVTYVEGGEWSVKDKLFKKQREVMVVHRVPLTKMAKGIGYKSSYIKSYFWNGFSMDEAVLIDDIKGTLLDYTISGDRAVVLATPFLGIDFEKVLKGENPLGSMLYIYSLKGR